jgi:hypothetical protein
MRLKVAPHEAVRWVNRIIMRRDPLLRHVAEPQAPSFCVGLFVKNLQTRFPLTWARARSAYSRESVEQGDQKDAANQPPEVFFVHKGSGPTTAELWKRASTMNTTLHSEACLYPM